MTSKSNAWVLLLTVLSLFALTGVECADILPFPFGLDDQDIIDDGDGGTDVDRFPVAIQIDAETEDVAGLAKVMAELNARDIPVTVFVTADFVNRNSSFVTQLFRQGHEIALHGYYTGEMLETMTLEEQRDLLTRALTALQGCQPCGTFKDITGFRPQYFSQNADTYTVVDELGLTYNCGYKVGLAFEEGHEIDALPYPVDGHDFLAMPITTVAHEGELVYLCDISCAMAKEFSGETFGNLLSDAVQQSQQTGQPLVALFHGWYTGTPEQQDMDYWTPFVNFLDALEQDATFMTTQDLVESSVE